ncbi:putative porin [Herbaspirillum sp. Sphag1AN]|uniref:porin n=1 Tax=unclassified Herbaspirillum TaxID=2624150 RepID=UPI0017E1DCBF|nr:MULTISPECIES: porin [unclassified Herbaspirillum]MBB3211070.1 putative porin [Herbaspirillum sp. Sphag1AN]MBB3244699.1 putative porin [Herbaspirillum sp. Sphag64]
MQFATKKVMKGLFAAGLATGASCATAQTDSVTVYGFLKADVESVWASGPKGGVGTAERVSNDLSVLGFKSVENLGGGMQAFAQIESNVYVDTGVGSLADRNDNVGLRGSFGEIFAGQYELPFRYVSVYEIDPFTAGIFASNSIMGNGFAVGANAQTPASFDRRQKNLLQYSIPAFHGINASIAFAAREEQTATTNPGLVSSIITYRSGPLYLAYGYEVHKDYFIAGSKDTGNRIGIAYSIGNTRVRFAWERLRYEPTATTSLSRDAWQLALTQDIGQGQLRFSYVRAKEAEGNATAGIGGIGIPGTPSGARQVTLGYGYNLSKRTELWGAFTKLNNEKTATYNLSANAVPGLSAGQSPGGFGIGVTHKF